MQIPKRRGRPRTTPGYVELSADMTRELLEKATRKGLRPKSLQELVEAVLCEWLLPTPEPPPDRAAAALRARTWRS